MCAGDYVYPKAHRLRRRGDYIRVSSMGRKVHTPHFIVFFLETPAVPTRLGITVSRKVGQAVIRNRVKRLIREFFRLNYSNLTAHTCLSIIAKRGAGDLPWAAVNHELSILLKLRDRQ